MTRPADPPPTTSPAYGGQWWAAGLAGLAAGSAALGVAELLGQLVPGATSPLVAVGDAVVRLAPPAMRDAGIEAFGTADKPLLLVGSALVIGLLSAGAGVLARTRPREGEVAVALLGAVALLAQLGRADTSSLGAVVAAAVTVVVGVALLRALLGRDVVRAPAPVPAPGLPRRALLLGASAALGAAALTGGVGRWLATRVDVEAIRSRTGLRPPVRPAPGDPVAAALDVPGLSPLITPTRDFYRIDTALVLPAVDPDGWRLEVTGMVERPLSLTYDELLDLPQTEADITVQCVSNEVGGDLVGTARWQGVLLRTLLERAGVRPGATQVVGRSVDDFTAGFPTEVALDGRLAMVALGMNGEPLPQRHGFPARLVVPGLYGYVSATKWLARIELTTLEGFDGFWIPRGWAKEAPVKVASRIDVPREGARVAAGRVVVAGVAWAPGPRRGIARVEVRADEGPWTTAVLGGALSEDTWRQWRAELELPPGEHLLQVRATDATGVVQDARYRPVRPDGATGHHSVVVRAG